MVETFILELRAFWMWLLQAAGPFLWPATAGAALVAAVGIAWTVVDARHGSAMAARHWDKVQKGSRALALAVMAALLGVVLSAGMKAVAQYREIRGRQKFDSKTVVSGAAVNQNMPSAELVSVTRRTQSQVFPGDFSAPMKPDGSIDWKILLENYGRKNPEVLSVKGVEGGRKLVTFAYDQEQAQSAPIEKGDLRMVLTPVADADRRANAYRLAVKGVFSWRNLTDKPARTRFHFRLPDHGGTLTGMSASLGGRPLASADESGDYTGEADVAPGATITAEAAYTTEARANLRIYPAESMRMIPDMTIRLEAKAPVFFERGSLTPTSTQGSVYTWSLKNSVTRQIISLAVPAMRSDAEVWWKLGYLAPVSLLLLVGLFAGLGDLKRPLSTLASCLVVLFAGLTLPMLFPESGAPPAFLGLVGAAAAVAGIGRLTDRRGAAAGALASAAALAGAAGPFTALVLWGSVAASAVWVGLESGRPKAAQP